MDGASFRSPLTFAPPRGAAPRGKVDPEEKVLRGVCRKCRVEWEIFLFVWKKELVE